MQHLPTIALAKSPIVRDRPLAWEDLEVGRTFPLQDMTLSRREIISFATSYDPQPFHIDEEAARATLLGGLAASGWHSCAVLWRRAQQDLLARCLHRGRPAVSDVRWLAPVRPDRKLRLRAVITDRRPCTRSSRVGMTSIRYEALSDTDGLVMNLKAHHLFQRRTDGAAPHGAQPHAEAARASFAGMRRRVDGIRYFEDVEPGDEIDLGVYVFTPHNIREFAILTGAGAAETARPSWVASAWHLTAAWMQRIVTYYTVQSARLKLAGNPVPLLGPASGIKHLRWHRSVRAGETVRFVSWAERKIDLPVRMGWGLLVCGAEGFDSHGRPVLSFNPQLLLERRSKLGS
jgi:acyl dehydratase